MFSVVRGWIWGDVLNFLHSKFSHKTKGTRSGRWNTVFSRYSFHYRAILLVLLLVLVLDIYFPNRERGRRGGGFSGFENVFACGMKF